MDDLEARLRALAAHRADQVPALDATLIGPTDRPRRNTAWLVAAVLVVGALAAGGVAWRTSTGGDDAAVQVPSPAGSKQCPEPIGASRDTESDRNPIPRPDPSEYRALLASVGTQVSSCSDAVVFAFQTNPRWRVAYDSVDNLRVTFQAARGAKVGTDTRTSTPIRPRSPWRSGSVTLVDESATWQTWVIATGARRPFRVVPGPKTIEIEILYKRSAMVSCTNPDLHLALTAPRDWFVEVGPAWPRCGLMGPRPFDAAAGFSMTAPIVTPRFSGVPVGLWDPGPPATTIDGREAWVDEIPAPDDGLVPAGALQYSYVLDWSPSGLLLLAVQGVPDLLWPSVKEGLDRLATSARYVP